jgi:hypothetical protein
MPFNAMMKLIYQITMDATRMPRNLRVQWFRRDDYVIVGPDQGMITFLKSHMCPSLCAYVTGEILSGRKESYIQGFRVISEGFEGCRDDEDKALNAARALILEFLKPRVSDLRTGKDFEVLFRRKCGALGLASLWLALIPFKFHRRLLDDAERTAERTAEDAERALCASHWTANMVDEWKVCAAAAASSPRVDLIIISAPEDYEDDLRGIGPELKATLCREMRLRIIYGRQCASMQIRCQIEGYPDVDQDEVCNAIRAAINDKIPAPHIHEFDFCFCGPSVAPEVSPEEAAAAAEEDRLEAEAAEEIRKRRRERHRQRREAARAAAAS